MVRLTVLGLPYYRLSEPPQLISWAGVSIHMNNTFTKSLLALAVGGLMLPVPPLLKPQPLPERVLALSTPAIRASIKSTARREPAAAHWQRRQERQIERTADRESRKARSQRAEPRTERYVAAQRPSDQGGAERHQPSAEPDQQEHLQRQARVIPGRCQEIERPRLAAAFPFECFVIFGLLFQGANVLHEAVDLVRRQLPVERWHFFPALADDGE